MHIDAGRKMKVTNRRTAQDLAQCMRDLADVCIRSAQPYPQLPARAAAA
jgi:hypothetical protein